MAELCQWRLATLLGRLQDEDSELKHHSGGSAVNFMVRRLIPTAVSQYTDTIDLQPGACI